jgi:hypothetical protein
MTRTLSGFDGKINPFKNIHDYFKIGDPIYYAANNPALMLMVSNTHDAWIQYEYSYDYDQTGSPKTCWKQVTYSVQHGPKHLYRIEFSY